MILRHLPRRRLFRPKGYGSRTYRRPFQTGRASWAEADDSPSILGRIKQKILDIGTGFIGIMIIGGIQAAILPWEETVDKICRIVPPKVIVRDACPSAQHNVYSPIHQDPPTRIPITRPNEFRVLIVEPGSGTEPVQCRLVNVAKSWRTRYDALSYTWGNENLRDIIIVDGLRTSVTKNLHSALTHLRHPDRERMLWVDALCINQDDVAERDEQVTKMGFIYSNARRVVVWLGEQSDDVKGAFATLESWVKLTKFSRRTNEKSTSPEALYLDWPRVFNLLRRPWFQRTWIIQEAVLGREPMLACGHETLSWKVLSDFCDSDFFQDVLPDDGPELTQALRAVDLITHGRYENHTTYITLPKRPGQKRASKKKYTPDFKLASTLYETRGFQCEDARDKVFGVLSMVTNVGREDTALGPNYSASVEEVFETVARWDIERNKSFEFLSYCSRKASTHPNMPSWVPDFSDIDDANAISFLRKVEIQKTRKPGSESLPSQPNPGFEDGHGPSFLKEDNKTVLVVSGMMVDTISRVGAVAENSRMIVQIDSKDRDSELARLNTAEVSKRRAWLEECIRIALSIDSIPQHEPGSAVDLWRSPTLGMSPAGWNHFESALALGKRSLGIHAYVKFLFDGMGVGSGWDQEWKRQPEYDIVDRHFRKVVYKRRFCATGTGRLGWVPAATREGDLVCLVSGAQVPIILRRVPGAGKGPAYMVLGDAFFDGLMLSTQKAPLYYVGGERLSIV